MVFPTEHLAISEFVSQNASMLERWITKRLEEAIERVPAVALLEPRQVGKTTLAQSIGKTQNSIYLGLELTPSTPEHLVGKYVPAKL